MASDRGRQAAADIDARVGIARQDLPLAFCRIFTPRVRGRRQYIESRIPWRGGFVEIRGPELDATDLGVLLAILAVAQGQCGDGGEPPGQKNTDIAPTEFDQNGRANAARAEECMDVLTSMADLSAMLGRDGRDGRATRMIRASIKRIGDIGISAESEDGESWADSRLIFSAAGRGGVVRISLNWRATRAITGTGQWAPILMSRFRELDPVGQILFHRLAAHCVGGQPFPVSLDRLAETCWSRPASSPSDLRKRRSRIRARLHEATPSGTVATLDARGVIRFTRRG